MRRAFWEAAAVLAAGLVLPFLGCSGDAGRLPVPTTTTTSLPPGTALRTAHSGSGVVCTVGGHQVTTDAQTARERWNCRP